MMGCSSIFTYCMNIKTCPSCKTETNDFKKREGVCRACTNERYKKVRSERLTRGVCRCGKDRFRAQHCYSCWIASEWNNLRSRSENRGGVYPHYSHVRLAMTLPEFKEWIINNPVPSNMEAPTIDRLDSKKPYELSNIRWLEHRENSGRSGLEDPFFKTCPQCKIKFSRDKEFFYFSKGKITAWCKKCTNRIQKEKYRLRQ